MVYLQGDSLQVCLLLDSSVKQNGSSFGNEAARGRGLCDVIKSRSGLFHRDGVTGLQCITVEALSRGGVARRPMLSWRPLRW